MTEGLGYVIELGGDAAGLVVKEGKQFRFYAAQKNFSGLERKLYRSPREAEDACRRIAWPGRAPQPQKIPKTTQDNSYISTAPRAFGSASRHHRLNGLSKAGARA